MRITNKIMQNNAIQNINVNKLLQDKLNTQITSQSKIVRPSDDPVVAIRALRLRSNLSEITQYYEKNVPDAKSWLSVTESALDNMSKILTDMYAQCESGSKGSLDAKDSLKILESLKALRDEVYATGDADYAGKNIFTGYRTDTRLTFQNDTKINYSITEQLGKGSLDSFTYVNTSDLFDINETNYDSSTATQSEIVQKQINRLRLAYDSLDGTIPTIEKVTRPSIPGVTQAGGEKSVVIDGVTFTINAAGDTVTMTDGTDTTTQDITGLINPDGSINKDVLNQVEFEDASGKKVKIDLVADNDGTLTFGKDATSSISYTPTVGSATDANVYMNLGPDDVVFIPETGEVLLGDNIYKEMQNIGSNDEIRVTYDKTNWKNGELRPEHYFACTANGGTDKEVVYNPEYLTNDTSNAARQIISYDVGFNQSIRVNTLANECFTHDIGRDVDELIKITQQVVDMGNVVSKLESMVDNDAYDQEEVKEKLAAAKKAFDLLNDKSQKMFEGGMTKMLGYLDQTNLATTNCGSRSARLELVENRLKSQQTNFKELTSDNEGADVTELAIKLSSAELSYNAALAATAKIVQNSLINFL